MTTEVHFKDFTKKRKPIHFKIGEHSFECVKGLSTAKLQRLVNAARGVDVADDGEDGDAQRAVAKFTQLMKIVLKADSFTLFEKLITSEDEDDDDDDIIDPGQIRDVIEWIVEVYSLRPTPPSSTSSAGSPTDDAGTSSVAGAPQPESIPSD